MLENLEKWIRVWMSIEDLKKIPYFPILVDSLQILWITLLHAQNSKCSFHILSRLPLHNTSPVTYQPDSLGAKFFTPAVMETSIGFFWELFS